MGISEPTEFFLLPLEPVRGLRTISDDVDRLVELDPKLRVALTQVEQHLQGLPSEEDIHQVLAPVLWVKLREHLKSQRTLDTIRRTLGDGNTVLRSVETALATTFAHEVLQEVIREAGESERANSAAAVQLQEARDDLSAEVEPHQLKKILIVVIIILVLIIVAGVLYLLS